MTQSRVGDLFSINLKSGYLITHRNSINESLKGLHPRGIELSYSIRTSGKKSWHQHWGIPHYGFSLSYFNLSENLVLGQVFYSTFFFEKYLRLKHEKISISYRVAPGLSYSNRIYDEENNPLNVFVSSRFNFVMEGNFLFNYKVNKNFTMAMGFGLTHYSNGVLKHPNIGVNIPSLSIGLKYQPREKEVFKSIESEQFSQSASLYSFFAISLKSAGEKEELDMAWLYSLQKIWHIRPRFSLVVSTDLMFSNATRKILKDNKSNRYRLGIAIGQQLELGKTSFLTQLGVYVFRPEKLLDKPIYFRWGLKYKFTSRLKLYLMIKTHYGKADLIETGIGYCLQSKYY